MYKASMEPCLFRHGKEEEVIRRARNAKASMEPCLFRHGKLAILSGGSTPGSSFNGAMSFQTW